MREARRLRVLAALLVGSACALRRGPPKEPVVVVTVTNRTGGAVHGVVIRFDRELGRADPVSGLAFPRVDLRLAPADTLRLSGAVLPPGASACYRVHGASGRPLPLEGRWILERGATRPLGAGEVRAE
ncbi:MAG: hypothetical protein ACREID_01865 [Planctomycetota bacterium]